MEVDPNFLSIVNTEYPNESIAAIINGVFTPFTNVAANPELNVEFSSADQATLVDAGDDLELVIHSHTNGVLFPSKQDMVSQVTLGCKHQIVVMEDSVTVADSFSWGGDEVPHLYERPFRHGVTDCYAAVRDWNRLNLNKTLPEIPREWAWWTGSNPYPLIEVEKLAKGFVTVSGDPEEGDVGLFTIGSTVVNHTGVYAGSGLMYHHPGSRQGYEPNAIPKLEPVHRYIPYLLHWVRYGR